MEFSKFVFDSLGLKKKNYEPRKLGRHTKYVPKTDLLPSGQILFYFKNALILSCLVPCTSFFLFLFFFSFEEKNNFIDYN